MIVTMIKYKKNSGFTLIELIVILVLVGVLAATILPRLSLRSSYDERVFKDELINIARFAQQLAMMRGRGYTVRLQIDNNNNRYGIETRLGAAAYTWFIHPDGSNFPINYPSGISTSPASITISYDALGNVVSGTNQTITITGSGVDLICIEASGLARDC